MFIECLVKIYPFFMLWSTSLIDSAYELSSLLRLLGEGGSPVDEKETLLASKTALFTSSLILVIFFCILLYFYSLYRKRNMLWILNQLSNSLSAYNIRTSSYYFYLLLGSGKMNAVENKGIITCVRFLINSSAFYALPILAHPGIIAGNRRPRRPGRRNDCCCRCRT